MCHLLSISPSLSNGDELDMDCLLISSYVYSINKVCASLTLGEERSTFKSSNLDNLLQICWLCSDGLEWPSIESADLDDLILFSRAGFWHAGRWWVGMPKKNFSLAEPWWVGALWMGRIWLTWVELKLDNLPSLLLPLKLDVGGGNTPSLVRNNWWLCFGNGFMKI